MEANGIVYIVDDDASMRRALERLADSAGFEARAFASGMEFLGAPHTDGPACVLLDLRLPDMHGLEVQRRLARTEPGLRVIVVTSYGDEFTRRDALAAGAAAVVAKPFDDQVLLDAIHLAVAGAPPHPSK